MFAWFYKLVSWLSIYFSKDIPIKCFVCQYPLSFESGTVSWAKKKKKKKRRKENSSVQIYKPGIIFFTFQKKN